MKTETKEPTAGHTPTPWAINAIYTKGQITHWGINGVNESADQFTSGRILDVRRFVPNHDGPTQEANAEFICLAVNHHAELVEALTNASARLDEANRLLGIRPEADWFLKYRDEAMAVLTRLNAK